MSDNSAIEWTDNTASYYCRWLVHDQNEPDDKDGADLAEVIRLLGSYTEGYLVWLDIQCGPVEQD